MITKFLVLFCTFLIFHSCNCNEDGYFMVIGSKLIRQNEPYVATIHYEMYKSEKTLQIRLSNNAFDEVQNITLVNNGDKQVTFHPDNFNEIYTLEVKVDEFKSTRRIQINRKQFSVFIQTDKSIYKPADKIQFRVLLLDAKTLPFHALKAEIFITDGADSRIKKFDNVKFTKGVYQNELRLSDLPVMGEWKINVKINGEKEISKSFDVAEYVLPKFEFSIETNQHANLKDGKIMATVKAKYTFGKIAKGNASITAEVQRHSSNVNKITKSVEVNGKKSVEFNLKEELGIKSVNREQIVKLTATFTEELSGIEQNATTEVKVHKTPYKIEIQKSGEKFKPGMPFNITAVVKFHNKDAPVMDTNSKLTFIIKFYSGMNFEETTRKVKISNGKAKIYLQIMKNITTIDVEARYFKTIESMKGILAAKTESNEYIQVRLLTENPAIKKNFEIEIRSTTELNKISYLIIGSGRVIKFKTQKLLKSKTHSLILSSKNLTPKSTIIVYYIANNGEIISDKIDIEFKNELKNNINLKLQKSQVEPGENAQITVKSQPDSFVGLLGIDQSVLILKRGNDIEMPQLLDDLDKYNEIEYKNYQPTNFDDFSDALMITNVKSDDDSSEDDLFTLDEDSEYEEIALRSGFDTIDDEESSKAIPKKAVVIRKDFPETWMFDSFDIAPNESSQVLIKKVPDTITSWIITGFSVNPLSGLGLTKEASKLNVFRQFFISTNLPYSIKRGEVVAIPITIFNYMNGYQEVKVNFFNENREFEFVEVDEDKNDITNDRTKRYLESKRIKKTFVSSNEGETLKFLIRPLKVGYITIKVTAEANLAGDGVEQQLLVIPEGVTQFKNEAILIDLRYSSELRTSIDIEIPDNAVADSTRIEATVVGDLLGPSIENLDKLIKLPRGCGEQNMLNFVPNIVVLDYLTSVNRLTPEIQKKAKEFLETGYQRELSYKHNDGSYSAFGDADKSGSTWLTAFVAKSFNQASKYIHIDQTIINQALRFLTKVQLSDGSFPEVGNMLSTSMQGGASNGIALTAYTLITFLENKKSSNYYTSTINRAVNYVLSNINNVDDNYSLAIASYALELARESSLIGLLNERAIKNGNLKYWKQNDNDSELNSINIEMTAYALQAFIEADQNIDALAIGKWLVTQRNEKGGFQSTQDTVVGFQALAKLGAKIYSSQSDVSISLTSDLGMNKTMRVNNENSLILQKFELSSNSRHLNITASGTGTSLLQISYRYNIDDSLDRQEFALTARLMNSSNKEFLHMSICAKFVTGRSSMAVMEVNLPSGFTFDTDQMMDLKSTKLVKKVETKDDDTVVIIYFDYIDENEICPEVKAYRTHNVAKQKPSPIIIYDYYDNSRQARIFYESPKISLRDISVTLK